MELVLSRYAHGDDSTLGLLFLDGEWACYTLEDEYRTRKVYGETRIPAGRYKVILRVEGGFHNRYSRKFPDMHRGMLWVKDVPGFEYILVHIGNRDDDTAGCLLVGDQANNNRIDDGFVAHSTQAYRRIYPRIAAACELDQRGVWITVEDLRP